MKRDTRYFIPKNLPGGIESLIKYAIVSKNKDSGHKITYYYRHSFQEFRTDIMIKFLENYSEISEEELALLM